MRIDGRVNIPIYYTVVYTGYIPVYTVCVFGHTGIVDMPLGQYPNPNPYPNQYPNPEHGPDLSTNAPVRFLFRTPCRRHGVVAGDGGARSGAV